MRQNLCLCTKVISAGLTVAAVAVSSSAFADVRLFAGVSQEQIKGDGTKSGTQKGLGFEAIGQYDLFSVPGIGVFVGGGLKNAQLKQSEDGVDAKISETWATGEAGVRCGLIPLLDVQGALGYDHGLSGKFKVEGDGMPEELKSVDVKTFTRVRLTGRGFFSLLPIVRVGLEASYVPSGTFRTKSALDTSDTKLTGWSAGLVAGVAL